MAWPESRALRQTIVVASEQPLIAESVRTALAGQGYEAAVLRWPTSEVFQRPRLVLPRPDLALMLSELDRPSRIRAASRLVALVDAPWVVLAGAEPGPAWGALLDAGVTTVMPTSTTLDELVVVLERVGQGDADFEPDRRRELVAAWLELSERRAAAALGLQAMTPRETEVLALMHTGVPVQDIAEQFGVSEATVRSQVKAVLRKLGVNSQLAAVALLELMIED